jgi:ParB family chromosome partitioning protein
MNERTFQEINLNQLKPNPLNPRKNFSGSKFDDLVESIRTKGVIEPILVRPLSGKKSTKTPFEIIAGERRFRASCEVAKSNGGMENHQIPAIVQAMTDDEAFDVMTIENLQREDLTELEEAQSFKAYINRHGDEALQSLAERCGLNPSYIKRRIHVLRLSKKVLTAWEEGIIKYGHCEQLARLQDEKSILDQFKRVLDQARSWNGEVGDVMSVSQLRREINNRTIKLNDAKFDIEKEGCSTCANNTEFQKGMFDDLSGLEKASCLNPECFKQKQRSWLEAHWKKYAKSCHTNGFRFEGELNYSQHHDFESWVGSPTEKCFECDKFISIIEVNGKFRQKQSCIGKEECFTGTCRSSKAKSKSDKRNQSAGSDPDHGGPRVSWHGDYFRENFYHERIPVVLSELEAGHIFILRSALFSILKSNDDYRKELGRERNLIGEASWNNLSLEDTWKQVCGMDETVLMQEIKKASIAIVLQSSYMFSMLHMVADHVGIDLQKEWRINKEYLQKKTMSEMMDMGKKLGIFEEKKALAYLEETLLKKSGKFNTCSKKELISVFLDSGVDLSGRVPEEILNIKVRHNADVPNENYCDEESAE